MGSAPIPDDLSGQHHRSAVESDPNYQLMVEKFVDWSRKTPGPQAVQIAAKFLRTPEMQSVLRAIPNLRLGIGALEQLRKLVSECSSVPKTL